MEGLNEIITELHAIREELTRLADLEEQRQQRRKAQREAKAEPEPDAGTIAGTLAAAFSDRGNYKRSELYKLEIETAKAEGREPVGKKKFFQMVKDSGFYLQKTSHGFYFCDFRDMQ